MVDVRGEPAAAAVLVDQQRLVVSAMQSLPVDYQIALELHYWEEMSVAEIAVVTEVAEGTVKSRLSRGRTMMRRVLDQMGEKEALVRSTIDGLDRWMRSLPAAILRHDEVVSQEVR